MIAIAVVALGLLQGPTELSRDSFGVPHIKAESRVQAFYWAGYAVAQDRLWQMENSRRVARGKMAEAFGKEFATADRQTLLAGYTDDEMQRQVNRLPRGIHEELDAYVKGVNAWIDEAKSAGKLPPGYAQAGLEPAPWTSLDSAAILIRLGQYFGGGQAGELRNWAAYLYLGSQKVKDRVLDAIDDLLWANDPESIPTVAPSDDPLAKTPPQLVSYTRKDTERQLAGLPKISMLELVPAIRTASLEETRRVAESRNVPYKTGSYAIVVSPKRSKTGYPILLSGPQMGHSMPSIVHEMSLEAPGLKVAGMDVPGIPGVVIGQTSGFAWGLTTAVIDVEDIFWAKTVGDKSFQYGARTEPIVDVPMTLKVKGEADQQVVQRRTPFGPIVFAPRAGGSIFFKRSSLWNRELEGLTFLLGLYDVKNADDVAKSAGACPLAFNFFYAFSSGSIGWRYMGAIPVRAPGVDPRFPSEASPATEWKGMLPPDRKPYVTDPKSGLICNWNNKPTAWWPNLDTPAWGPIFRNEALVDQLTAPKLGLKEVETAPWAIARIRTDAKKFLPMIRDALSDTAKENSPKGVAAAMLVGWDGWALGGMQQPRIFDALLETLRSDLLMPLTGNFLAPDFAAQALQPSMILQALRGKTKVNFLAGRTAADVVRAAFDKAFSTLSSRWGPDPVDWRSEPSVIRYPGSPAIPYNNRGTYIQIIELATPARGRNVLPPGIAESGAHSLDQAPLADAWLYKPIRFKD